MTADNNPNANFGLDPQVAAQGFDALWGQWGGEFTKNQNSTPMLDKFIELVKTSGNNCILEGGSGPGIHALLMASVGLRVIAIDSSEVAIKVARQNAARLDGQIEPDSVQFVHGVFSPTTLQDFQKNHPDKQIGGIYANSVLHFYDRNTRVKMFQGAFDGLPVGGILAVSFKTDNDALRRLGEVVGEEPAGVIVNDEGYGNFGINRLFVGDPSALADDMRAAGFTVLEIMVWQDQMYNAGGAHGPAEFVGFVCIKEQQPYESDTQSA